MCVHELQRSDINTTNDDLTKVVVGVRSNLIHRIIEVCFRYVYTFIASHSQAGLMMHDEECWDEEVSGQQAAQRRAVEAASARVRRPAEEP